MDKLRPVIAIVLCLVIWGAYFKWFSPKTPPPEPKKQGPTQISKGPDKTNGNGGTVEQPPDDPTNPPPPAAFAHPSVEIQLRVIENEVMRVELTNVGASVRRLILKGYKDPFERDERGDRKELAFLDEFQPGFRSLSLRDPAGILPLDSVNWESLEWTAGEVKYRYTTPDGLRIVKTIGLGPEKHAVKLKLEVENISETPLARGLEIIGAAGIVQEASGGIYPSDAAGLWRDGKTYSVDTYSSGGCCGPSQPLKDLTVKMRETDASGASWNAAVNKFFVCAIIPRAEDRDAVGKYRSWAIEFKAEAKRKLEHEKISRSDPKAKELLDWTVNTVAISAVLKDRTWLKGEKSSTEWVIYVGPKEDTALEEGRFKDWRLGDLLDFGWFGIISKLLLTIMGWMHMVFRNWGLAVIALVLIVRMCIFPISKRAQVSMFRMQKLQPQIKSIQERFKGDPTRVNAETMKFMKEQGVNPIGGCLPLFLQLPIFLGLYNALLSDIHLRQQPFFGWINDLSQPDHLANLPFNVPMHATNAFNILPLFMMATWFIQAYMAPRSPDPQMAAQQKMFMIMPLVIGWMMYMSPSGLVLYWLVSTAWGIAEQQFIKKTYLK